MVAATSDDKDSRPMLQRWAMNSGVQGALLLTGLILAALRFVVADWKTTRFDLLMNYVQDDILSATILKPLLEGDYRSGFLVRSQRLGFPGEMTMGDFLLPDSFYLFIVKILGLFSQNIFVIYNQF